MQQRVKLTQIAAGLAASLALGLEAAPAAADVYAWRTEDGTYAFADDEDHVPARYAAQARRVPQGSIEGYDRFTAQDPTASRSYADRLAARLDYLRQLNAPSAPVAARAAAAPAGDSKISFSTGGEGSPQVELPIDGSSAEPVVVEPVLSKRTGELRTRRTTVVRRGDEVIAVIKGPRHVFNPSTDIHDEDALEDGSATSR